MLIDGANVNQLADAIRQAIHDDQWIDQADKLNARLVKERINNEVITEKAIKIYQNLIDNNE